MFIWQLYSVSLVGMALELKAVVETTLIRLVGEMLKFDWLLAWVINHLDPKFAS